MNSWPGAVAPAACSRAAAACVAASTVASRAGRTGMRSRVRWSIRDLRRERVLPRWAMSASRTGHGAAHGPHRAGSSAAHWARSR